MYRENNEEEEAGDEEKNTAPKKQPLSLEEMIARREAEKKAQEKVSWSVRNVVFLGESLT